MAVLAADVTNFRGHPFFPEPMPVAGIVDVFYKGALAFYNTAGQITPVSVSGSIVAGVVCEQTTILTINDPVRIWLGGLFYFAAAAFTLANNGELLFGLAGSDNPADVTITAAGNSAAIGYVVQRKAGLAEGWAIIQPFRLAGAVV